MIDKCLYVDFSRLSLKKILRINIYPLSENPLGGFPFSLPVGRTTSDCLRYRIADKKRELALSPNTQHHQFRIILQCRFYRKSHLNIQQPIHTIVLLRQNDFRLRKRYA